MSAEPLQQPPYLDWNLDRWKLCVILLLFLALLAASIFRPTTSAPTARLGVESLAGPVSSNSVRLSASIEQVQSTARQLTPPSPLPAQLEAPPLPLTLASLAPNAVVPLPSVGMLEGTAFPGSRVEIRGQFLPSAQNALGTPVAASERLVGAAVANADGRWRVSPEPSMEPGHYVLSVRQVDEQGVVKATTPPVVVTVLAAGEGGPLSLTTPAIRFPAVGARLHSGRITFTGNGLPGMRVRLYLDNRDLGETTVNSRDEWRLATDGEIAEGIYIVRAAALNPQGEIFAESPPVAFVVFNSPMGAIPPAPGVAAVRSLKVSSVSFGGQQQQSMVLSGVATPHAAVTAWAGEQPVSFVNSGVDGRWQIWLPGEEWRSHLEELEIRTQHGESIALSARAQMPSPVEASATPVLLSPRAGQVLTTRRPLLLGLAQPSSEVAVVVNSVVVARVLTDDRGQWTFQVVDPLPSGQVALTATTQTAGEESGALLMTSPPVVITIVPQLSNPGPADRQS
jgi:hypothetical protein